MFSLRFQLSLSQCLIQIETQFFLCYIHAHELYQSVASIKNIQLLHYNYINVNLGKMSVLVRHRFGFSRCTYITSITNDHISEVNRYKDSILFVLYSREWYLLMYIETKEYAMMKCIWCWMTIEYIWKFDLKYWWNKNEIVGIFKQTWNSHCSYWTYLEDLTLHLVNHVYFVSQVSCSSTRHCNLGWENCFITAPWKWDISLRNLNV